MSNDSDSSITVTRAMLLSDAFTGTTAWTRHTEIPPGTTRDLRVLLGTPVCDPDDDSVGVLVEFTLADGATGHGTVTPTDRFETITKVAAQDCLAEKLAVIAQLQMDDSFVVEERGGVLVGTVSLTITPTGGTGSALITSINRSTLVRPEEDLAHDWPLNLTVDADGEPLHVDLPLEPSNCNPHIVAEDKRGTFFAVNVVLSDGPSGIVFVPVTNTVRRDIYAYIAQYCGW